MKAAGIVPKGVLDFFGLHIKSLLKVDPESAMQVSGDDLLLDPQRALPPPRIRGKLTKAWIADGLVYEQFGGIFLYVSLLLNAGPDVGWFSYPPLAESLYTPSKRADVWAQLITFTEVASLAVAV